MKERTLKSWPFDTVDSITPLEIGGGAGPGDPE